MSRLNFYGFKVSLLSFLCLISFATSSLQGGDDAVIIDAQINVAIKLKGGRELSLPSLPEYESTQHVAPTTCTTPNGKPGRCVGFEECFPLRHLVPDPDNNQLNEDIRGTLENKNCSAVIHAGESNYRDVCCPIPAQINVLPASSQTVTYYDPGSESSWDFARVASCGKSFAPSIKIVNGTNTVQGEYPWMVLMFGKTGKQTCGGSLISENMVLTAAHCIANYGPHDVSKIRLSIGDYNIRSTSDGQHEVRGVKRIIKHKFFDLKSFVNDVALLRLDKPVSFSSPRIQPICLPSSRSRSHLVNKNLIVAGWGRTSYGGPISPILQKVKVRVWSNQQCSQIYNGIAPAGILSTMICAGDKGLDSCVGDSGGPLMHYENGSYQQIGIVSFGKGCGSYPGVYTRVSEFLPWIQANINK